MISGKGIFRQQPVIASSGFACAVLCRFRIQHREGMHDDIPRQLVQVVHATKQRELNWRAAFSTGRKELPFQESHLRR